METNARYILVGVAAVALLILTSLGLLWLRKSTREKDLVSVAVTFREQSLSGLREGSSVTMRGIAIGNVKSLSFTDRSTGEVQGVLGVAKTAPVRLDSEATIQRNLVTGLSTVDLSPGSPESQLLNNVTAAGNQLPNLKERPNQFESMRDAAPELIHQSSETLRNVQRLLSDENRQQVTQILRNIETITAKLASPETGVDRTLADVRAASNELKAVSSDARGMIGSLTGSISKLDSMFDKLTGMVGESVRVVSERVTDMARGVQEATTKLGDPRKILSGPATGELGPGEGKRR